MQQRARSPKIVNSWIIAAVLCINTFSKVLGIFITIPYNIVMMEAVMIFFIAWANEKVLLLSKEYNGPLVKTTLEEIIVNTF